MWPFSSTRKRALVNSAFMQLDTKEAIQRAMANGHYEPEQSDWVRSCLLRGGVFVDVGASFGHYTTLASEIVGPDGRVFAFEPSPLAHKALAKTIGDNRLSNVTLTNAAVGAVDGAENIYMPVGDKVHSPSAFYSDPSFVPLQVALVSLDQFEPFASGAQIDVIKIDVEGYEPNVIRGMTQLASQGQIKNLLCEFNSGWLKRNNTTPDDLHAFITSLGFCLHKETKPATLLERNGDPYLLQDKWFVWRGSPEPRPA